MKWTVADGGITFRFLKQYSLYLFLAHLFLVWCLGTYVLIFFRTLSEVHLIGKILLSLLLSFFSKVKIDGVLSDLLIITLSVLV